MGLSSKQVFSDGFDRSKTMEIQKPPPPPMVVFRRNQQQQFLQNQPEQLKCPRCDSANTKFCYYNNYNKSQPRHFCRACKRHWTKGGTLRNVPVGGGRKNKRMKKPSSAGRRVINNQTAVPAAENQRHNFPLSYLANQKNSSELLNHGLLPPPASSPALHNLFHSGNLDEEINYSIDHRGLYLGSNSLPSFTFLNSTSFDHKPFQISSSFQSSDTYNHSQEPNNFITHPMNLPTNTSSITNDMTTYWNWEDVDTFVPTDLNLRWDDSDLLNPPKL